VKAANESVVVYRVTAEVHSRAKTSRTGGQSSASTASFSAVVSSRLSLASLPSSTGFIRPLPATHRTNRRYRLNVEPSSTRALFFTTTLILAVFNVVSIY